MGRPGCPLQTRCGGHAAVSHITQPSNNRAVARVVLATLQLAAVPCTGQADDFPLESLVGSDQTQWNQAPNQLQPAVQFRRFAVLAVAGTT